MSQCAKGAGWASLSISCALFLLLNCNLAIGAEAEVKETEDEVGAPVELLNEEGYFSLEEMGIETPQQEAIQGGQLSTLVYHKTIQTGREIQTRIDLPSWLVGKKEMSIRRPLAVRGIDGILYIVDGVLSAVIKYDMEENSMLMLSNTTIYFDGDPAGIYVMKDGSFFVADPVGSKVVHFDANGRLLNMIKDKKNLSRPVDIYVNEDFGKVYVLDKGFSRVVVFNLEGEPLFAIGDRGRELGQFLAPSAFTMHDETLYVTDRSGFRLQVLPDVGMPYAIGVEDIANPSAIAVDKYGRVYVADNDRFVIHVLMDGEVIETFRGGDQPENRFKEISGIWISDDDFLYVADTFLNRILVIKINPPLF
jgi:DNA-binding beta-propeller fold protein YncE